MVNPPTTLEEGSLTGDRELVERAARGDRAAFGQLYDRHVRPVYWQAYAVVRDGNEAEDITQDVFITTWDKLRSINLVDESVLPWLLVTARFTALNSRRRTLKSNLRSSPLDADLVDERASVEDEVAAGQIRAEIEKAAAALSPPIAGCTTCASSATTRTTSLRVSSASAMPSSATACPGFARASAPTSAPRGRHHEHQPTCPHGLARRVDALHRHARGRP